jgi:hypothetical protein
MLSWPRTVSRDVPKLRKILWSSQLNVAKGLKRINQIVSFKELNI